jgi:hypothetical protein
MVGDQAQFQATLSNPSVTGRVTWSSSDTSVALVNSAGQVKAQRPGSTTISVRLKNASSKALVTVIPRPGGYSAAEIDYFQQIAFGFEYGTASEIIRKWDENPRLQVFGVPTTEDREVLNDVISELNLLTEEVQIEMVEADPTMEVHFVPLSQFSEILPSYVPGNWGYFSVWFDGGGKIYRVVVLLASDAVNQEGRSHLIREEVTQGLGLAKDSNQYSTSIFFGQWTTTQTYDPIDKVLIEMLYRPQLLRGMEYRPAVDVLRKLTRRGWAGTPLDPALSLDQSSTEFQRSWVRGKGEAGVGSGGG